MVSGLRLSLRRRGPAGGAWKAAGCPPSAPEHDRRARAGAGLGSFASGVQAAGRHDAVVAARMLAAHGTMVEVMAMVERERTGPAKGTLAGADGHAERALAGTNVPENVRVNVLENVPVNPLPADGLNARQRWFIAALEAGRDVTAPDLARRWSVSEKTARRDIAALRRRGVIEFVGAFRRGRYQLGRQKT